MQRTLALATPELIGQEVLLQGWIQARRDHGKIMFLDLRDREGLVQMVSQKALADVKNEDIVEVLGLVKARPETMVNPKLATGTIEIEVKSITILSHSKELPLPIDTDGYDINEETRLKYRYLDLRRPRLQKNIKLRSKFVDAARQYLFSQGFTEIETPMLTKSTPEGSRDFLVPSRMQPGKFYALPQSPQQYKQLLMAAGFERYFQIARCMRDEDLRADRGFEHSQIDIEMSFVNREDVMKMDEALMTTVIEALGYTIKQKPFPVITYAEAMKQYGADKFDMRSEEDKKNGILAFAWVVDFPFFEKTTEGGWTFTHNPFSAPKPEHKEWLMNKENIGEILTTQYDMVCNGYEVGGGSIRSHEPEMLEKVFEIMGYDKQTIQEQFGHMLEAFGYGVPPHGGLAHGIERLLMTITGEPYLREVVAFPQTAGGKTSVMDAPSVVADAQLVELGISAGGKKKDGNAVYEQIVAMLTNAHVSFDAYEHEPVRTSEESASVRHTDIKLGAKALVMYADDKPIMVAIAGDKKVDMKSFKHQFGVKDLRMATPEEVIQVTSVPIGAVPPFGHIFGIPLYMDRSIKENETVVFNAGLHNKSIQLKQSDYETVAKPILGEYSKVV
jgi:aspartyl-tRNA synthetase